MTRNPFVALIVAVCALASLPISATRADAPCGLKRAAKLDMTTGSDGRVRVPMTIAGQTFSMLVDTGGVLSMLTPQSVDALDLTEQPVPQVRITQYGGLTIDRFVTAHDIVLGTMKASQLEFLVMPRGGYSPDIGGLLGPDILKRFDADFDFANGALSLFSQDHCEGQVVYWTHDPYGVVEFKLNEVGQMTVPVTLDGKEIDAIIDTGATNSAVSLETIEREFGIGEFDLSVRRFRGGDLGRRAYRYPFKTLSFQSVTVNHPNLLLVPDSQSRQPPGAPKMLLGMTVLRQLHLYIAYGEHKIYVTPADAH